MKAERTDGTVLHIRAAAGEKKKVLIVNTNSGGHAVIGFWTAKDLAAAGHAVTILTVGEESSDKMKKLPFSRFNVSLKLLSLYRSVKFDLLLLVMLLSSKL